MCTNRSQIKVVAYGAREAKLIMKGLIILRRISTRDHIRCFSLAGARGNAKLICSTHCISTVLPMTRSKMAQLPYMLSVNTIWGWESYQFPWGLLHAAGHRQVTCVLYSTPCDCSNWGWKGRLPIRHYQAIQALSALWLKLFVTE